MVSLSDEFMKAVEKDESWNLIARTNGVVTNTLPARDIFKAIAKANWQCGDPGVHFSSTINRWNTCKNSGRINSSNPCLTGDTLIAVADGRGFVSIKTLAEKNKDIPIFTLSKDGKIIVKPMLNARLTKKNSKVYKVTFDSGLTIRTTLNHKFLKSNGEFIELKDISIGESIKSCIKHQMSFNEAFTGKTKNNNDYYFWENNGKLSIEHRLIANFKYGIPYNDYSKIVHHEDYDSLNNDPDNIKLISKEDHILLHSKDMRGRNNPVHKMSTEKKDKWRSNISLKVTGVKNPRFSNITNEEIISKIQEYSKTTIGNYFTKDMWKKLNFPLISNTSNYRHKNVKSYCKEANVTIINSHKYKKLEQNLESIKQLNLIFFKKSNTI
jgi:ribonucleotide reductase alpha subunit